ncbi:MAG: hypothetical protein JWN76_3259 [Chitinophagaceae bacterium]|nr:hypothetical protein [Chitinophagaceae bacterium]
MRKILLASLCIAVLNQAYSRESLSLTKPVSTTINRVYFQYETIAQLHSSALAYTNDVFNEGKYLVRITPLKNDSYGFTIEENAAVILMVNKVPYFAIAVGFTLKQNAVIVVKWYAQQLVNSDPASLSISIDTAKTIGVSEEDLTINLSKKQ